MKRPYLVARAFLAAAATVTGLGWMVSLYMMTGTGTFHADSYYIPLREFVAEDRQRVLEDAVVDLYNTSQFGTGLLLFSVFTFQMVCILFARWSIRRANHE